MIDMLYRNLPVFFQNLLCSLYGWKENRIRFNKLFEEQLLNLKKSEYWKREEIKRYKENMMVASLKNAFSSVPYYKNVFKGIGLNVSEHVGFSDIYKLPILTKEDIRHSNKALLSTGVNIKELVEQHTSGTTGKALTLYKHPNAIAQQWAVWFRHRARFNCDFGNLHVNFTGKQVVPIGQKGPPYWRFNSASNQYLINMQHVSDTKIHEIVGFLNTINPKFYSGYPSIMAEVARLALKHDLPLFSKNRPSHIFCGAENTLDYQKEAMEQWTGAKITDQYGLTEGNCNMSRCEYGYYHEDFEFCHIECVDPELLDNGRKKGKLVGTSFSNPAMPLLRYNTGDIAIWAPDDFQCPCGRQSTVIESVEGRVDDAIKLIDGRRVMRFDYIFKGFDSIREAQVCQFKEGEVMIKIVVRDNFESVTEDDLKSAFSQWICSETKVFVKRVESIEKTSSGKFRAVKSYL